MNNRLKKKCTAVLSILILFVAPLVNASDLSRFNITPWVKGLDSPYSIAFLPNGDALITEKPGRLRLVHQGLLQPEAIAGVPKVYAQVQGGLMDIVLHPRFAENHWLYLSFSEGNHKSNTTKVLRGRYRNGRLDNIKTIFTAVPAKAKDVHFGARMTFLPDETLLITVGDGFEYREQAQNLNSHLGKTIRVTDEGEIPDNNPFINQADALPSIWSYGHRNAQGIIYDAVTDSIYAHEHGPMGGDELNKLKPGKNYGWPLASFGLDYSGAIVSPFTAYPGTEPPLVQWTPSLAPSGLTQCRGCLWPEWEGDLFVGMLAGQQVRRIHFETGGGVKEEALFTGLESRVRDVRFGPEGALYLVLQNGRGEVLKVMPK
ncbi:PQQ-dependent sugar dehydrogenase [Porticoccaceae bacterium]|nr:PQQ-dependent sugar dehydrogenase [Porticoccaceae bacterium]